MPGVDLATVDWSTTALPEPADWPPGLAAVIATVMGAPIPMALAVGTEAVLVYNPAYAGIIGRKHPAAFGRPAREALSENWDLPGHGDAVARVYRTGEAFYEPDTILPVSRTGPDGPREFVHFSRAYTAVRDDGGRIVAVLAVVAETTEVNRTLSGMAELTARLSAAISVDSVAREALAYAVEDLRADHARLLLQDGPGLRMARRSRVDGADDTVDRLPPVWSRLRTDTQLPSVVVAMQGTPLWLGPADLQSFTDLAREPLAVSSLRRVATVPIRTGSLRGSMSFGWENADGFSPVERAALTAVGNLVGQSLARAQRFDEQRHVADTLQLSMLPASLPSISGFGIAGRYQPGGVTSAAGGDFYDAFPIDDSRVCVVIGDVVGHGFGAAAIMGQVRAGVQVLARRCDDPADVLSGLDPFVAGLGGEVFVTMLVGFLYPQDRTLVLANAGHPVPLLGRAGGGVAPAAAARTGAPVGVGGERPAYRISLDRGDALILYTDGLVELPDEDPDDSLRFLTAEASAAVATADPRQICARLLQRRRLRSDDAAVLALVARDEQHRLASLDLPAEATSPGEARRWARTVLSGWEVAPDTVDAVQLGLSELVTNAVLHARTGVRVELDAGQTRLLVLVSDAGTHGIPEARPAEPTDNRGRGLSVVEAIADGWGSEQTSHGLTVWFEVGWSEPAG
jgi:anti-sigma regulatory factor (Ser/Thr protein kinase)